MALINASPRGKDRIRVFAGNIPRDTKNFSREQADQVVVEALKECGEYAAKRGIFLGIENHGGIVAESDDLLDIIRADRNFAEGEARKTFTAIIATLGKADPLAIEFQRKLFTLLY